MPLVVQTVPAVPQLQQSKKGSMLVNIRYSSLDQKPGYSLVVVGSERVGALVIDTDGTGSARVVIPVWRKTAVTAV